MKLTAHKRTARWIPFTIALLCLAGFQPLFGAELQSQTVKAWNAYVQATERRIDKEISSQDKFLAMDFQAKKTAAQNRSDLLSGKIPVAKVESVDVNGKEIEVPGGLIHHWRGSVFIPGVTLDDVYSRVENPSIEDTKQEDVLDSAVLERDSDSLKLFLKLQRSAIIKVVYNTEHQVKFERKDVKRAWSRSIAYKIAEVENPRTPEEKEKPQGKDSGFLWRLNSYWRYQQVDGGVIVELESITLSRSIPAIFRIMVRPIINKIAHESMERTLDSMRIRLTRATAVQNGRNAAL